MPKDSSNEMSQPQVFDDIAIVNGIKDQATSAVLNVLLPLLEQQKEAIVKMSQRLEAMVEQYNALVDTVKEIASDNKNLIASLHDSNRIVNDVHSEMKQMQKNFSSSIEKLPAHIKESESIASLVRTVNNSVQKMQQIMFTDSLTGLYNQHCLQKTLAKESGTFVGFCLDIDYFKKINDQFGHDAGDTVLKSVASVASKTLASICNNPENVGTQRKHFIFRMGGEEFGVLLQVRSRHDTKASDEVDFVWHVAESVRRSVQQHCGCTVSIGVAETTTKLPLNNPSLPANRFNVFGDKQLYIAKKEGRNRVVLSESLMTHLANQLGITTSIRDKIKDLHSKQQ